MVSFLKLALAGALLYSAQASAQTSAMLAVQQTVTTGMVGLAGVETARLSVLNLSPVTATPLPCNVVLSFVDEKNNLLKQVTVSGLAPQVAASLDLTYSELKTAPTGIPRAQIRGTVRSGTQIVTATGSVANLPSYIMPGCPLVTTLATFDNSTGVTHTFTSDTRHVSPAAFVTPMTPVTSMQ